jgi:catechol 2,3-dioxygenase-like lactoylglutathione lyase family enzyme
MLGDNDTATMIAVRDLDKAKKFYEEKLGLRRVESRDREVLMYKSGRTTINVYRSQFAGTNRATAMVWNVGESLDGLVRELEGKGISFEHYDMPGMTVKGNIHIAGDMKVAWFKDPDGNILSIQNH